MWSDKTMESRSSYEFKGVWMLVIALLTSQHSFSPGAGECICNLNATTREQRNSIIMNATSDIIVNITAKITSYLLENTKYIPTSTLNTTQSFNMTNSLLNTVNSVPFNSIRNMVLLLGLQPWHNKLNLSSYVLNTRTTADKWVGSDWNVPLNWTLASMNLSAYIQNVFIYKLHEKLDLLTLNTSYPIGGFTLPRSLSYSGIEWKDRKCNTCTCLAEEGFSYLVEFSFDLPKLTTTISEKVLRTDIQLAVDNYASQAFDNSYIQSDLSGLSLSDLKDKSVTANVKLFFKGSYINLSLFNGSYWTPNNMSYANVILSKMNSFDLNYLNVSSTSFKLPRIINCTTYSLEQNPTNNRDVLQYYKNGTCPNITAVISNLTESTSTPTASPQPTPTELMSSQPKSASPTFAQPFPTISTSDFKDMSMLPTVVPSSYSIVQETARGEVSTITSPKTQLQLTSTAAPTAGKPGSNTVTGPHTPSSVIPSKPTTTPTSQKTSLLSTVTQHTIVPQASSYVMSQSNTTNSIVNTQPNSIYGSANTQSNNTNSTVNTQSNSMIGSGNAQSNSTNSNVNNTQPNNTNSNITSQSDTANNSPTAQTTKTTSFTSSSGLPSKADSYISSSSASPNIGQGSQTASTSPPGTSQVPVSAKSTIKKEANVSAITVPSYFQGGNQTTALLPNQKTTTSNSTNKTLTTTTSLPTTPFDEDPFFKPVVPIITKVYNDRVLLSGKMNVLTPLTERILFYKISIPVAVCILITSILCIYCLQIDWLVWASKKKDSGAFGVTKA